MLIDWFTVGAQALNFLVLVWLLRRFLYKPILDAIDARESKIASQLADAKSKEAEAKKDRETFESKNDDLEKQRAAILSKAAGEAKAEGLRLVGEAQQQADALRAKQQNALDGERQALSGEMTRRTVKQVFDVARKALTDLAGSTLEAQMVDVLDRRLRGLNDQDRDALKSAFQSPREGATVRSAFELPPENRSTLEKAITEVLAVETPVTFETSPDLVSGIELTVHGEKLAWSIAEYLRSLDESVEAALKTPSEGESPSETEVKGHEAAA